LTAQAPRVYTKCKMGTRWIAIVVVGAVALLASGCNLRAILIKAQVDGTSEYTAAKAFEMSDPELVGPVMADSIVTSNGFLYYVDDYEPLLLGAAFSRIAYGVGWLGYEAHALELAGQFDEAERVSARAGVLYSSALRLAKRALRLRDEGFDAAVEGGLTSFKAWVDENFTRAQDAEVLLVAGAAYFTVMIESEEGIAAAVDLPIGRYLVERSIELDPELRGGLGYSIIGTFECSLPELMGGRPKVGMQFLEKALALTDRGSHGYLVTQAQRCAVALQDRKLYHALLMEVIEAGDVPEYRLPNKLARREAELLLKQTDEFFFD